MAFRKSAKILRVFMRTFTNSSNPRRSTRFNLEMESETEPLCSTGLKLAHSRNSKLRSRRKGQIVVSKGVPSGHMAVYVGEEKARFVIRTHYLSHHLFKALLKRSEEEFGFHYRGGINMACEPVMFEHVLWMIGTNHPTAKTTDLEELFKFYG